MTQYPALIRDMNGAKTTVYKIHLNVWKYHALINFYEKFSRMLYGTIYVALYGKSPFVISTTPNSSIWLRKCYQHPAPHNRIANRTGFSVYIVLVLNVISYPCLYFLDRILFHHDFHHDSCDYHGDFYGH